MKHYFIANCFQKITGKIAAVCLILFLFLFFSSARALIGFDDSGDSSSDDSATMVVATTFDDSVPGIFSARFVSMGPPTIDDSGDVAFLGVVKGSNVTPSTKTGIWYFKNTAHFLAARTGYSAPGANGQNSGDNFAELNDPIISGAGALAFRGKLKFSGRNKASGIWSNVGNGILSMRVQQGDLAPGANGGKFLSFDQIALTDASGLIVQATLSGVPSSRNRGIWIGRSAPLRKIIQTGDTVNVLGINKVVKSISIFQLGRASVGQNRSFSAASGKIVYRVVFTDKTSAILGR